MSQVASDPKVHAPNHQMPRVARPATPDRAPSPFESLLDDTAVPEPTQPPPESKASAGGSTPPPAKSKDCKAAASDDDAKAVTTKADDVAPTDNKPADEENTEDGAKKIAGVQATADVGATIKPDADQKPASEDKTDVTSSAPSPNDGAPAIVTSDTTAIIPAPAQTPFATPGDQTEQPLQQVALVADTKPQAKQLDPDPPKVLVGKKIEDGKQADADDNVETNQPVEQTQDALQLLNKNAPAQHAEAKPQTDSSEGDKQRGSQRSDIAVNNHRPDAAGPVAPGTDAGNTAAKASADTTAQLAITPTHSTANAATPAAPASQPMPQPAAVPLSGVAIEIAGKALAGKNRFEIRLDPPELGRIDVRLDVDRDGNVTSRLTVDRPDTLDLLRRDVTGLERALQDAGLKTANNGLQFSLRDQSLNEQQTGRNSDTALMVANDEVLPSIDAIPQRYGRLAGQGSGLDIRV